MATPDHYQTLNISATATQAEVKQAYRRLAKLFHPDGNQATASHERIATVNAAYEVLGDPERRRSYDHQRQYQAHLMSVGFAVDPTSARPHTRQERTAAAQAYYRQQQRSGQQADADLERWLKRVYIPVSRLMGEILQPLQDQIDDLAADPFDDVLMGDFQAYLEDCRSLLTKAEQVFQSLPNPANVAGVAANLYYCMNQIGDALEQLEFFTMNYDEDYLHTGQEMFRIAAGLRREASAGVRSLR
jgi:molecular chaperone DnaJ